VERHRRGEREQHQRGRDEASPEAGDQQDAPPSSTATATAKANGGRAIHGTIISVVSP